MTASLGETTDPKALVPGNPDGLEKKVDDFRKVGEHCVSVRDDLGKVDVGDWSGNAGEAFRVAFGQEPPKWTTVGRSLDSATKALTEYADTLRWAQNRAAEAIALWEKGEQQARQTATHAEATAADVEQAGEGYRRQAREVLASAREQLTAAGSQAAGAIRGGSQQPGALDSLVEAVTSGWSMKGKASASGPDAGVSASWPKSEKLGELKAFAELAKASAEGSIKNGPLELSGKAAATVAAEASLSGGLTNEGLAVKAEALAGGKASAEGKTEIGPYAGANAKVEAFAGAKAGAGIRAGMDGLHASADAFAGGKVSAKAGGDIGGLGINATAEGWAGAGAEAGVHFGPDQNGTWRIGANAGAAVGLGGKLGFEVTVDPKDIAATAGDAAEFVGDAAQGVGDTAESAWNTATGWVG